MTVLNSVKGPLDVADLGTTLMHEHVFVLSSPSPQGWDEELNVANAVRHLSDLKDQGIDTIVDMTVPGIGRNIPRVQRIADAVPLNIVVASGIYALHRHPMEVLGHQGNPSGDWAAVLRDLLIQEVSEGIEGTPVKAGILKAATGTALDPVHEQSLRIVAQAHVATGIPISTHTAGVLGDEQLRIFREEGADPSRVVIGHSDESTDLAYLEGLIDGGAYVGMDRIGIEDTLPFETRIKTVIELCRRGYSSRMVLSNDYSCDCDMVDRTVFRFPNWGYAHMIDDIIPALLAGGVTDGQIREMMIENPRRIFGG